MSVRHILTEPLYNLSCALSGEQQCSTAGLQTAGGENHQDSQQSPSLQQPGQGRPERSSQRERGPHCQSARGDFLRQKEERN